MALSPFVFVIPIRNPWDHKTKNYRTLEAVALETIRSLSNQRHTNSHIVVVCHKVPEGAEALGANVRFLDVANHAAFGPNTNSVQVDKGLKYILGILYARSTLNPSLIMPMDADDFVHRDLALHTHQLFEAGPSCDGYLITKGAQVRIRVNSRHKIKYQQAFWVDQFNKSCGSCRVFNAKRLYDRLTAIDPDILESFEPWNEPDPPNALRVAVPAHLTYRIKKATLGHHQSTEGIVNVLGRHIRQEPTFEFKRLDLPGAAKGCGHGNHDGPRRGRIHTRSIVDSVKIRDFLDIFGLTGAQTGLLSR